MVPIDFGIFRFGSYCPPPPLDEIKLKTSFTVKRNGRTVSIRSQVLTSQLYLSNSSHFVFSFKLKVVNEKTKKSRKLWSINGTPSKRENSHVITLFVRLIRRRTNCHFSILYLSKQPGFWTEKECLLSTKCQSSTSSRRVDIPSRLRFTVRNEVRSDKRK